MKNWKNHIIVLILVSIAELIGILKFKFGPGTIVLLPMLYALIMGVLLSPKFLKVVNDKDMKDAGTLITISLMLLMARYGTMIGPTLPKIIKSSPALILQELGNVGTVFLGVPLAVMLGLKRETIGAAHSIAREPNIALISDVYGLDGQEGQGVMGVYICGTVFGTVFFGILASFCAAYLPLHPYSLAMASGVGSASMMTACVGSLSAMFPQMQDTLAAFGAASNMLSGLDGLYMSLWVSLPLTEWLYKKSYKLKYGVDAPDVKISKVNPSKEA
ncbi:hypothetical protein BD780_000263 [Clostridium tetanomorphum]|uniref:DUF3100 domain-containing protein n=1 Tax=Clostridium tetanomorphum TaxID=1553 RepID=A0A923EAI6_CLOTT|nr:DUF3100 domain-containing protein [Clostridium tetanomorphum]KAJ51141.1 hypothetical protein CTM_14683 [Clostridium tetanomorphum DSM 665]MBC2398149.1 DUF3100 domain-containing protein [Clostridium tetanomorphum]MBP1864431.1 hypothetical protein [Clostridium tetanomorphum]NRS83038.1 hypothetical protein [Clostridium tetanomorphum]NRZ98865.1 hypothetical protein [Clostridium tetanomorphum]